MPTGPAADATFVATFGALGDVNTVVPDCQTTYFYCQDTAGTQVPRNDQVVSRGIPDSLADPPYTAGDQVTVACALGELFVAEAFSDGSFSCKACYSNEHQDLNLLEDGTCADPDGDPCVENFTGIVCSAPQTIAFDSTAGRNGCSPGYWRSHLERWSEAGLAPSADFDATFGVTLFEPNITLGQAVELGGGYPNDLARHRTSSSGFGNTFGKRYRSSSGWIAAFSIRNPSGSSRSCTSATSVAASSTETSRRMWQALGGAPGVAI